ncbi:DUF2190 family protein [Clavibacter michiganensis subsp. michiganensis]|uniref:capsid cement protein n=1 Tax=Clavibacter michiganensis TaxID=28447 RepID=UPI001C650385|nr:capsid cement protein [Clavibacter michiganensis]MBW8025297.1 DUF2190 family protein [Clavibacter michiganensis subsp. michiganensis]
MAKNYVPLFRPGQTVTFGVTTGVTAGQLVEVGAADRTVTPAAAASSKVVGVAAHDAAIGDNLTVEISKPIHELVVAGAVTRGQRLESATDGKVRTLTNGTPVFLALTNAADGTAVQALAL